MTSFKPFGVLPAMVTPLNDDETVNEGALRKLCRFLIDGGVHGLFPVGTTGEFYALTRDEKRRILEITVEEAGGKVPVYFGSGAISTREVITLNKIAEESGATAVSVLTPMFISPSQQELADHYRKIAEHTTLPILLYNNLPKTGLTITPDTAASLAEVENIVGIKDSSGDFTLTLEYIRRTRGADFHVLAGRDTLIHACLVHGGAGSIAACANVAPRLVSDIYDKFVGGDVEGSLEAQFRLAPLRLAFTLGSFPTVIKESLALMGIDMGPSFSPVGKMSTEEKEQLKKVLEGLGVLS